jgi:hypothetical protein
MLLTISSPNGLAFPETGKCKHPGALTPISGELIAPVPVWRLHCSQCSENDLPELHDAIYSAYLRVLEAVLRPQLMAVAARSPPPSNWIATVGAVRCSRLNRFVIGARGIKDAEWSTHLRD